MELLICGAASWSVCVMAAVLPVTTRLPFAVHRTATSLAWGGDIAPRDLLMASHKISGRSRSSLAIPRCARSTMRLGLGGLTPATAEYERGDVLVESFPGVWVGCFLEGVVEGFWMPSIALESAVRVF